MDMELNKITLKAILIISLIFTCFIIKQVNSEARLNQLWFPELNATLNATAWNDEFQNIITGRDDYAEGFNITEATIGTVYGNLIGDVTGDLTGNIDNCTITGATFTDAALNLDITTVTNSDSPYTISNGDILMVDTSGGAVTLTCDAAPSVGDIFSFTDLRSYFSSNALTINPNGKLFRGSSSNQVYNGLSTTYPVSESSGGDTLIVQTSYKCVYGGESSGWTYYDYGYE